MSMRRKLKAPSAEAAAEIDRGIAADSDAYEPLEADWARARRLRDLDPQLAAAGRVASRQTSAKQHHVVPRGDGWAVRTVGLRISEHFDNKSDAVEHARRLAKASGAEWVEYRRDGTVRAIHRRAEGPLPVR